MAELAREDAEIIPAAPNQVLERPELAVQIANVIATWSLIEHDLTVLYSILMGLYLPPVTVLPHAHPIAKQVFDQIESFRARLDLICALCRDRAPQRGVVFSEQLVPKLRARNRERNKIAHGAWTLSPTYPNDLILTEVFGESRVYKKHDFVQITRRMIEVRDEMKAFIAPIYEAIRSHNEQTLAESDQLDSQGTPPLGDSSEEE